MSALSYWTLATLLAALFAGVQAVRLVRRNSHVAQVGFAWLVIVVYVCGVYTTALLDPSIYIIRSGIMTRLGLILAFFVAVYTLRRIEKCQPS